MKRRNNNTKLKGLIIAILIALSGFLVTELKTNLTPTKTQEPIVENNTVKDKLVLEEVPEFNDNPYVVINDNIPEFTNEDYERGEFEEYSELDELGRVGVAYANINKNVMPTEKRTSIGMIKPAGWHTIRYDNVNGKYLYNRCHLIGFQLAGENANEKNLMTGTRYLNVDGMLPFEDEVADYIRNQEPDNHVLYRVTPIYEGTNLLAKGVQMEAYSIEDNGEAIQFNVFVYNAQPGIEIDFATGNSHLIN